MTRGSLRCHVILGESTCTGDSMRGASMIRNFGLRRVDVSYAFGTSRQARSLLEGHCPQYFDEKYGKAVPEAFHKDPTVRKKRPGPKRCILDAR